LEKKSYSALTCVHDLAGSNPLSFRVKQGICFWLAAMKSRFLVPKAGNRNDKFLLSGIMNVSIFSDVTKLDLPH